MTQQPPTISPISIHGRDYITVADRLRLCNADEGFSVASQHTYELAGRYFISVTLEIKGRRYIGDSEIKFNAKPSTPDGSSPIECAQTSAYGRALGMAGYGSIDSIASADELLRSQPSSSPPVPLSIDNGKRAKLNELLALGQQLHVFRGRSGLANYASKVLVREIAPDKLASLSEGDLAEIESMLHTEEAPAQTEQAS